MKVTLLILLALSALAYGKPRFTDCGSGATVNLNDITITGCDNPGQYCIFKRGTYANMSLPFTPNTEVQQLTARVTGTIVIPVPFPVNPENACNGSGLTCPLQPFQTSIYRASVQVFTFYPPVSKRNFKVFCCLHLYA
nr:ecdysteroid-regulated 16 kDa protein-like [Cherax quadricarinatus]